MGIFQPNQLQIACRTLTHLNHVSWNQSRCFATSQRQTKSELRVSNLLSSGKAITMEIVCGTFPRAILELSRNARGCMQSLGLCASVTLCCKVTCVEVSRVGPISRCMPLSHA